MTVGSDKEMAFDESLEKLLKSVDDDTFGLGMTFTGKLGVELAPGIVMSFDGELGVGFGF